MDTAFDLHGWSSDISNRLNQVEISIAKIQGKDERDYDRLNSIEETLKSIDKKVSAINLTSSFKIKIIIFVGWILMLGATIVSGSDRFLHAIGIL